MTIVYSENCGKLNGCSIAAGCGYSAVVPFHDCLNHREPDAVSSGLARTGFVGTVEAFKKTIQFFLFNMLTGIGYRQGDTVVLIQRDTNRFPVSGILSRVIHQQRNETVHLILGTLEADPFFDCSLQNFPV